MELSYGLRLPTDVRCVSVVRRLAVTTLEQLEVRSECVDDIALAVTEACANVVQHAGSDEDFEVTVVVEGTVCRITVVDHGVGYGGPGPGGPAPMGLDPDPLTHGRGIGLMELLVDQLHFAPDHEGTRLVLVKQLELLPGSVLAAA